MTENVKKFLEAMSKDEALREKLTTMDKDAIIAAAKELGFELTEADFVQPEDELNEDELDAVAGGGSCGCAVGGGGTKGSNYPACGCVAAGWGKDKDGDLRCSCTVCGAGATS